MAPVLDGAVLETCFKKQPTTGSIIFTWEPVTNAIFWSHLWTTDLNLYFTHTPRQSVCIDI